MPRNPGCELCPLHEMATNVCIFGEWRGDPVWDGPAVMVIGQSPGKREDFEGHPWIGPAGRMMTDALRQAGIFRYYATNAAKCSPEVNDLEIDRAHWVACADYLDEEIETVQPKYILALGNPAVQRLLGRGRVSEIAGKEIWSARYQAWVVPALHPAAILRAKGREPGWLADILRFGRIVRGEIEPPPNVPPVRVDLCDTEGSLYGLSRLLSTEPTFAFDFEANVPDKKLPGWCDKRFRPYSVAFSFTGGESYCVPIAHPDVDPSFTRLALKWMGALRQIMTTPYLAHVPGVRMSGPKKGVHNIMYDALVWYRLTGYIPYIDFDTMPLMHLLDENRLKNLKWAGRAILGWPDWDIDARKLWPLEKLYPYNGYDSAATILLLDKLEEELRQDEQLWRYWHELEMPKLRMLVRMVANGVYVDRSRIARNLLAAWRRRQAADAKIPVLNPGSDTQVARWLYDDLKLPVLKKGKKHASTDEDTIKKLAKMGHTGPRLLLDCRRPRKEISTYYRPVGRASRVSFDSRYHPDIRTTSVETGRLGSGFHTTPRPEESALRGEPPVRPIYSAPAGYVLIQGDYSQIEARLCAWSAAGRPTRLDEINPATANMLIAFAQGREIYREQAAEGIFGPGQWVRWREVDKNQRQIMGKVPVLAMLYRISPLGLIEYAWKEYEIDWTLRQGTAVHSAFHRLWPEFQRWHSLEEAKLRNRGWARSSVGRLRRLPGALAGQHDDIRAGINAPIQSVASDITQEAGILCDRDIQAAPQLDLRLVGDIHDALLVQAPERSALAAARWLEMRMRQSVTMLRGLGLLVPAGLIKVEVTIGPWGEGIKPEEWAKQTRLLAA